MKIITLGLLMLATAASVTQGAEALTVSIASQPATRTSGFTLGSIRSPDGNTITVDSSSLRFNNRPWTPVMGEFHYARYLESDWREELLKMKVGGVDIVASYVFWIHHEEIEGQWNWTGQRNLKRFVETANEVGLKVIVRAGPWCHGEVRNGGLPDWVVARGQVRSDDPAYLEKTRLLYQQIAAQLRGLLWKDGGPVIGLQLENEYSGPAEHLLTLKRLARDAGLDVPLYTRTGWPALSTPMPFGEIIPLFGVYAEGFWDRELSSMPGLYWSGFHFSTLRTDSNIANEALGRRGAKDAADIGKYPYLTCEIGGGMMSSYHRRIVVDPTDIDSVTLVKLGSGSNSPGYYMYHGGTNPEGQLSSLMEQQNTAITNWNDLPFKNYDFQAPLGQFGQVREQYHRLRRLHLFLHDFGSSFAGMPTSLPDKRPSGKDDVTTLRWSIRSDGRSGYVFVNNRERQRDLPAKSGVQFSLDMGSHPMTFPSSPVTVPAAASFFWPFNMELINGARLIWATAQPLCTIEKEGVKTVFFAETAGIPAEFAIESTKAVLAESAQIKKTGDRVIISKVSPGTGVAIRIDSRVEIVLLSEADSLGLWKGQWRGQDRVFLSRDGLVLDGDVLRLSSFDSAKLSVGIYPSSKLSEPSHPDGVFTRFDPAVPQQAAQTASIELIKAAGTLRSFAPGKANPPVVAAPVDADFAEAAVWRIKLPQGLDLASKPLLRLSYVGDVARVMIGDTFIMDDFYNGKPLEIGLHRYAAALKAGELRIAILPLQKKAPIYMPDEAKPSFASSDSVVELKSAEIVPLFTIQLPSPSP